LLSHTSVRRPLIGRPLLLLLGRRSLTGWLPGLVFLCLLWILTSLLASLLLTLLLPLLLRLLTRLLLALLLLRLLRLAL
jgi:hypothetical protein